jgi:hypothetical protein
MIEPSARSEKEVEVPGGEGLHGVNQTNNTGGGRNERKRSERK